MRYLQVMFHVTHWPPKFQHHFEPNPSIKAFPFEYAQISSLGLGEPRWHH